MIFAELRFLVGRSLAGHDLSIVPIYPGHDLKVAIDSLAMIYLGHNLCLVTIYPGRTSIAL